MGYADRLLARNPYVYWRQGASPIPDETATGIEVVVGSGVTFPGGPIADAFAFDGTSDSYGDVPALNLSDTDVLTIEMFINPTYTNNNAPLIYHVPSWDNDPGSLFINHNNAIPGEEGTVSVAINNAGISRWTFSRDSLPEGEYHHVAFRIDRSANELDVLVDGEPVATTMRSLAATPGNFANSEFVMMTRSGIHTIGALAEIVIFKELVSDAEIAGDFAAAIPEIPLLAYHSTNDLGDAITSTPLSSAVDSLFKPPHNAERLAGMIDYRCIYLKNLSEDELEDVRVWIETPSAATDADEAIGIEPSNPAQTIANATVAPIGVDFDIPGDYSEGLHGGDLNQNFVFPIWIERTIDAGAAAGTVSFTLAASWSGASEPALFTISYDIIIPVELTVDPDHVDSSDDWTYEEAADNPDHPFIHSQAAAMLAQRGDTVRVWPSTMGKAGVAIAGEPLDINLDPGIVSDGNNTILPAVQNGGNDTIEVVAEIVGGVRPKVRRLDFYGLDNWLFENFQKGYDEGSGDDHDTVGGLQQIRDVTFRNIYNTGGGWICVGGDGVNWFDRVWTRSPFQAFNNHDNNGRGFHILGSTSGTNTTGHWKFTFGGFEDVQGEDCLQISLGDVSGATAAERGGTFEVRNMLFKNIRLNPDSASPIHTDCIQVLGVLDGYIANNRFVNCFQPLIASDGENGRLAMVGNIVDGCQNGLWIQGTREAYYIGNTIRGQFAGIAIGNRINETRPDFRSKVIAVNNIATTIQVDGGTATLDPTSIVAWNVFYQAPGLVTPWGTQLAGFPEFGPSARLAAAGLTEAGVSDWGDPFGRLELSNSPTPSAGIGQGNSLAGLGLPADILADSVADILGRPYATPRDVGALQSDPGTLITPAPRPPYVLSITPTGINVARDANVAAQLLPVPGQTIDATTVIPANCVVTDLSNKTVPVVVALGAPDGQRRQALTVDPKFRLTPSIQEARLRPLGTYNVALSGIKDTDGSEIQPQNWSFRVEGDTGPNIDLYVGPPPPGTHTYQFLGSARKGSRIDFLEVNDVDGVRQRLSINQTVVLADDVYDGLKGEINLMVVPEDS